MDRHTRYWVCLMVGVGVLVLGAGSALGFSSLMTDFNSRYGTAGTALDRCSICHSSVPDLNSYGADYAGTFNFGTIESLDSDGDGFTNLDEITALTWPGDSTSFPATQPPPGPTCTDADSDGFSVEGDACGQVDCDDTDAQVFPGAVEICGDGIDQDCNGSDLPCDAVLSAPNISVQVSGINVAAEWNPVSGATGYELLFAPSTTAGPDTNNVQSIDLGNETSINYDLWEGAAYHIAVQAYNDQGRSDYSNILNFIVPTGDGPNEPTVPQPPSISLEIDGEQVTISWAPVSGATGYILFYAPATENGADPNSIASADVGGQTSVTYDLWPDAAYYVAVQAYNEQGESDYSNILDFDLSGNGSDVTGATLYGSNCSSCHGSLGNTDVAGASAQAIQTAITFNDGGMGFLDYLDSSDLQAIEVAMAQVTPPTVDRTGQDVYDTSCAGCHTVYGYDATGNIDLANMGSTVQTKLASGHGGNVSATEISNVAAWLNTFAAEPPPAVARTGQEVYDADCAGCHKVYGYDATGNIDLASLGNTASTKLATGHGGNVPADEISNVAAWLNTFAAEPPPAVDRTGQEVYDANCAGCHKVNGYDAAGSIDLAGQGGLIDTKLATGHGGTVTAGEVSNLAGWLDTFQATDPYADCTSCHAQPPSGNSSPNTAGAHQVHTALNGIGNDCASCHDGASHNGMVDMAFASTWDAQSGTASSSNGNCSNISCHGGQTTPSWDSGSINVNSQCTSCHTSAGSQVIGYSSGEHDKHVRDKRIGCTECHDTGLLAGGHFSNLSTSAFEQDPASTIKSSIGYSEGTCSTASCHGSERW